MRPNPVFAAADDPRKLKTSRYRADLVGSSIQPTRSKEWMSRHECDDHYANNWSLVVSGTRKLWRSTCCSQADEYASGRRAFGEERLCRVKLSRGPEDPTLFAILALDLCTQRIRGEIICDGKPEDAAHFEPPADDRALSLCARVDMTSRKDRKLMKSSGYAHLEGEVSVKYPEVGGSVRPCG